MPRGNPKLYGYSILIPFSIAGTFDGPRHIILLPELPDSLLKFRSPENVIDFLNYVKTVLFTGTFDIPTHIKLLTDLLI